MLPFRLGQLKLGASCMLTAGLGGQVPVLGTVRMAAPCRSLEIT